MRLLCPACLYAATFYGAAADPVRYLPICDRYFAVSALTLTDFRRDRKRLNNSSSLSAIRLYQDSAITFLERLQTVPDGAEQGTRFGS